LLLLLVELYYHQLHKECRICMVTTQSLLNTLIVVNM